MNNGVIRPKFKSWPSQFPAVRLCQVSQPLRLFPHLHSEDGNASLAELSVGTKRPRQ